MVFFCDKLHISECLCPNDKVEIFDVTNSSGNVYKKSQFSPAPLSSSLDDLSAVVDSPKLLSIPNVLRSSTYVSQSPFTFLSEDCSPFFSNSVNTIVPSSSIVASLATSGEVGTLASPNLTSISPEIFPSPLSEVSSLDSSQASLNAGITDSGSLDVEVERGIKAPLSHPFYVVGVGASAGGLEALEQLFVNMPSTCGMAFVVVQHLSPNYKSMMAQLLAKQTTMTIKHVRTYLLQNVLIHSIGRR